MCGKSPKLFEFGYKLLLAETKGKFILDFEVMRGKSQIVILHRGD